MTSTAELAGERAARYHAALDATHCAVADRLDRPDLLDAEDRLGALIAGTWPVRVDGEDVLMEALMPALRLAGSWFVLLEDGRLLELLPKPGRLAWRTVGEDGQRAGGIASAGDPAMN